MAATNTDNLNEKVRKNDENQKLPLIGFGCDCLRRDIFAVV